MKTLGVLLCLLTATAAAAAVPAAAAAPAAAAVPAAASAHAHVFYVSITRVKWNVDVARLDVSVRIFTDDLEEAIVAKGGPRLRLWTGQAHADRDRHVSDYLASRLAFRVNGVDRQLTYAGMEDALDATACLVQITGVDRVETIEVENRILIEMFDTQANVMRFEIGGERKYVNLSKKTVTGTVRFGS